MNFYSAQPTEIGDLTTIKNVALTSAGILDTNYAKINGNTVVSTVPGVQTIDLAYLAGTALVVTTPGVLNVLLDGSGPVASNVNILSVGGRAC